MILMLLVLGEPIQPTSVYTLVKENPIAADAGIKAEDQILSINGQFVDSPSGAVKLLSAHKKEEVKIEVKRMIDGQSQTMIIPVVTNDAGKVGMALVGKGPISYHKSPENYSNVVFSAAKKLWALSTAMIDALGQLFTGLYNGIAHGGKNAAGQTVPGFQDIHGVLAVIKIGADIARQDWSQLFLFTVLISLDLAIVNLVPWPGLDGSHIAFMAVEAVRGKPMHERAQGEIVKWGFVSLLLLMALIMVNDVTALVSGKLDLRSSKNEAKSEKQQLEDQQAEKKHIDKLLNEQK
jgi:RIP metalloprotease RseP